jgi:hypothetical protein
MIISFHLIPSFPTQHQQDEGYGILMTNQPGGPTEYRPTGSLQPSLKVTSGNKSLGFLMGFLKEKQRGFSVNIFFVFLEEFCNRFGGTYLAVK